MVRRTLFISDLFPYLRHSFFSVCCIFLPFFDHVMQKFRIFRPNYGKIPPIQKGRWKLKFFCCVNPCLSRIHRCRHFVVSLTWSRMIFPSLPVCSASYSRSARRFCVTATPAYSETPPCLDFPKVAPGGTSLHSQGNHLRAKFGRRRCRTETQTPQNEFS
ncbi:hypothetical protein FKM82_025969 [Ascaphus truei]